MNTIINSEYVFTDTYVDKSKRTCKVKIILKVNHETKCYTIVPHGTPKTEFGFINGTKNNYEMWKAILKLIEETTDFAEDLVNPLTTIDDVISNINVNE